MIDALLREYLTLPRRRRRRRPEMERSERYFPTDSRRQRKRERYPPVTSSTPLRNARTTPARHSDSRALSFVSRPARDARQPGNPPGASGNLELKRNSRRHGDRLEARIDREISMREGSEPRYTLIRHGGSRAHEAAIRSSRTSIRTSKTSFFYSLFFFHLNSGAKLDDERVAKSTRRRREGC